MIEKMAMGLVDQMAEEKMIDKEAEEYYVYTLVSLMEKFIIDKQELEESENKY